MGEIGVEVAAVQSQAFRFISLHERNSSQIHSHIVYNHGSLAHGLFRALQRVSIEFQYICDSGNVVSRRLTLNRLIISTPTQSVNCRQTTIGSEESLSSRAIQDLVLRLCDVAGKARLQILRDRFLLS